MTVSISGPILSKATKLTSSTATTILQAKSRTVLASIVCTEIAGATPALTIEVFDGTTSFYLRKAVPMTARQTFVFEGPFALNATEELRATASAGNQVDCIVTYFPNVASGSVR